MATAVEHEFPLGKALANHQGRSAIAIQGWPSVFFGVPFVVAGGFVYAAATGRLGDQSAGMHAPPWIVAVCGLLFALAGVFTIVNGLLGVRLRRRTAAYRAKFPNEPWGWDHPWRIEGTGDDRGRTTFGAIMFALIWCGLLVPFNYIVFVAGDVPKFVVVVVTIFDAVGVMLIVRAIYHVLRALKFGRTELRFGAFPFHTGETVDVTLPRHGALASIPALTARLRCIQERYETHGTGDDRRTVVACYELWGEEQIHREPPGMPVRMTFSVPENAPSTALSERPARYWELEITGEAPGIDYAGRFLVPVYGKARH